MNVNIPLILVIKTIQVNHSIFSLLVLQSYTKNILDF